LILSIALASALPAYQAPPSGPPAEARSQLFAGRYQAAADSYEKLIATAGPNPEAYYGLVRALLALHRSSDAVAKADEAVRAAPQSAAANDAEGLALFRRGELANAEARFRTALKLQPEDPAALVGMASIYQVVSKNKTALALGLKAYAQVPDDPELALYRAQALKGAAHIGELQRLIGRLDPASEFTQRLRTHLLADQAAGDRELRRLTSPYASAKIKLFRVLDGVRRSRGVSLHVQFNHKQTLILLLDTGASGISVAPKAAERAGLQELGGAVREVKGIGDKPTESGFEYVASDVQIGNVVFADYPVSVFRAAQDADIDGLIGADVFKRFLVGIDIPGLELVLDPRPGETGVEDDEPRDASDTIPAGYFRFFHFGNHLALPTSINGGPPVVFLLDTGSTANLIDVAVARKAGKIYRDDLTSVKGIQGKVEKVQRASDISLAFTNFRQSNPDLIAIDLQKMSDDFGVGFSGILGMPVLEQMKTTIDYREGRLRMERKATPLRP
jgi:tetratricopeptide (TPR) repeat protein